MPRRAALTDEDKGMAKAFRQDGHTLQKIADRIGRSRTVVRNYLLSPDSYGTKPRSGRPSKLTPTDSRHILRKIGKDCRSIHDVKCDLSMSVFRSTIRRVVVNSKKFEYKKKKKTPRLTESHRIKRLEWAMFHNPYSREDWRNVIFSDEKKFNGDGPDGWAYYWHDLRTDERVFSTRQNGGASVMVWACFSYYGKSDLIFIEGNMNSTMYIEMLKKDLIPWANMMHGKEWIIQQDNASIHVSRETIRWFKTSTYALLEWPARSPDLNPIANLWSILSWRVYADNKQYNTVRELKDALQKEWMEIDLFVLQKLTGPMPNRCDDTIRVAGSKTKY